MEQNKFVMPKLEDFDINQPLFCLDNGHGGLINGVYQTKGKRSPNWHKGTYYEGLGNRDFVKRIMKKVEEHNECSDYKIQCLNLVPENEDVKLQSRVSRVNSIHNIFPYTILISIHSNGGGGTGWEVFTTKGFTKSDLIAEIFAKKAQINLSDVRLRKDTTDGDLDKEAQFYVLHNSSCPAILTENFFMDNPKDYEYLFDETKRNLVAELHFDGMFEVVNLILNKKLFL